MSYKDIREEDTDFKFVDGFMLVPRAMLHVTPDCPHSIASAISQASRNGWLKVVANVPETELMWGKLQK
jgi:hypothetical protein